MKQVVIGDIHGRVIWNDIIAAHPDADRYIFIGDYLDSFDEPPLDQLNNLRNIIAFKKKWPDRVVLLLGNHDMYYWPNSTDHGAGYQPRMRPSFEFEFHEEGHLFEMAFIDEHGTIYTHAGISTLWLENVGGKGLKGVELVAFINDLLIFKPYSFDFYPWDRTGYGDDPNQGPTWIRPTLLKKVNIDAFQVVGHSPQTEITHEPKGFYLIDCLGKWRGQYLVRKDKEFKIHFIKR